jgi:hypothetical protein
MTPFDFYNFSIILDEVKRLEKERIREVKCGHTETITEIQCLKFAAGLVHGS